MSFVPRTLVVATALSATLLSAAACGSGKKVGDNSGGGGTTSPSGTATASSSCGVATKADTSATTLPASVKSKGTLVMATDPTYAPIEFTKSGGGYQGFDVDLATALGKQLGIKIQIQKAQFDGILAGLTAGRYAFSMSAFTDNCTRQQGNDFVTYFTAGTSIGVKKGNPKKVSTQDDLCGLNVAAERGTIQATALTQDTADGATTLKGQCAKDGKSAPKPVLLPDQAGVNSAVISGRADAFTGDSPIVAYQAKLEGGQIQLAGATTDKAPYGIAFPKDSELVGPFFNAMQKLISDGTYTSIIKKWGLQDGAVTAAKVNGASS